MKRSMAGAAFIIVIPLFVLLAGIGQAGIGTLVTKTESANNGELVLFASNDTPSTKTAAAGAKYNPNASYQGIYEKTRIYMQREGNTLWKGNSRPANIYSVTCADALKSLGQKGTWTGNLNRDGSCGSDAEPANWAVGNYLNFAATPDDEE